MWKNSSADTRKDSTRSEACTEARNEAGVLWIDRRKRLPTREDADKYGCILAFNVHEGMHLSNPESYNRYGGLCEPYWAHTPAEPEMDPAYLEEVRSR